MLALVLIFISDVGYSSEKISMAVLDMDANNVSAMTSATVTDLLRTELFNTGRFTVAERKNMDKILKEQTFQQAGCTDTECAVEVGKLLNINQIAVGSVSKLGEKYLINIRMVDVEKGSVLLAESIQCDSEDKLGEAVKTLAFNVSKRVPVIGKILYVSGEEVIINVGAADEVRVGMKFGVERLGQAIKDDKGKVIMQEKIELQK